MLKRNSRIKAIREEIEVYVLALLVIVISSVALGLLLVELLLRTVLKKGKK